MPLPAALFGRNRVHANGTAAPDLGAGGSALVLLAGLLILPTGYEGALTYQNADRVRAEVLETDESSIIDTGLVPQRRAALHRSGCWGDCLKGRP